MGGAVSKGDNNDDLVDNLLAGDYIKSSSVERVFRAIDRADYFTEEYKDNAYKDLAWKSGNLHLSAPCIYSEVMESLKLEPGQSFLNLGSGTGYLSTMVGLIIGPFGVNHGIEIHKDVVQYANTKLEEFKTTSPAVDEYDFCEPRFIEGNCLCLDSENRPYDRVYCGASCPESHENYLKNLVKVGGILVMPFKDELLQVMRISDTSWDVKHVLPVSFASLIMPSSEEAVSTTVFILDATPLSLQEACRIDIRRLLRRHVEVEHPDVLIQTRRKPKKKGKRQPLRRVVIPIFEETERRQSDSDEEGGRRERSFGEDRRGESLLEAQRHTANQISAVIDIARSLANQRPTHQSELSRAADIVDGLAAEAEEIARNAGNATDDEDVATEEPVSSNGINHTEDGKDKPKSKREKFDSGLGDEMENGRGLSSDEEDDIDMDSDDMAYMEERLGRTPRRCRTGRAVMWKKMTSSDRQDEDKEEEEEGTKDVSSDGYSTYMKAKINDLPLPLSLKSYINFYRYF